MQNWLGMSEPELLFDVSVHVGTLFAVVLVFRKDVAEAFMGGLRLLALPFSGMDAAREAVANDPGVRMAWLIILGTIPTGVIGMGLHRVGDRLFSSPLLASCMLVVTGCLLWATRWAKATECDIGETRVGSALVVGVVQGLAIFPGISRSGSTIAAGLFTGMGREVAARFSFLLSIPAILAALGLELVSEKVSGTARAPAIILGAVMAAIFGYVALRVVLRVVRHGKLHYFAPYCWVLGLVVLTLALA